MMEWIPVSDHMPEGRDRPVIVTLNDGMVLTMYYVNDKFWEGKVVAWMPLPPAYEKK